MAIDYTEKQFLDKEGLKKVFELIRDEYSSKDSFNENIIAMDDETIESIYCESCGCKENKEYDFNGHEYVDMGDAGIWATCNIGATKPEEYGLYFAWGETTGYANANGEKKFTWNDYKFGTQNDLSKYNSTDKLTTLELEDDAAHVNMGGDWVIPSPDAFFTLIMLCNSEVIENYKETGVKGILFKLKTDNSKELFFPVCGIYNDGEKSKHDSVIFFFSETDPNNNANAICFEYPTPPANTDEQQNIFSFLFRCIGITVRGYIPPKTSGTPGPWFPPK